MSEMDPKEFAQGVNDAIRALRAVYGGVRSMLGELRDELAQSPAPLFDLGVRVRPVTTRINPDEKYLRTWEGRFYSAESPDDDQDDEDEDANDEEDPDEERADRGSVTLVSGQSVAFVKVVLYHSHSDEGEPHLLCGVLRDCRVPANLESLIVPRHMFRRVLEIVGQDTKPGPMRTKASVRRPRNVARRGRGEYRLQFRVDESPSRYRLFDLSGRAKVGEIALQLKGLIATDVSRAVVNK